MRSAAAFRLCGGALRVWMNEVEDLLRAREMESALEARVPRALSFSFVISCSFPLSRVLLLLFGVGGVDSSV